MLLESLKMEIQRQVALAMDAHVQLLHSQSKESTTPRKKVGELFRINQTVVNKDTGYKATVLRFSGNGFVVLRSHYNGRIYSKHYYSLEAL